MTEKQGGSDVRANRTTAVDAGDGSWRLTGHKWFCSAPMCDLFLVLAQVPGAGLTCFLVPRVLPSGERNVFRLQRLKDKLGNRSNASSEVEFEDTVGWAVGPVGRGLRTILEMVRVTRLDCVLGSAALMRAAVAQAVHHATYRSAFGGPLRDKPLMAAVLADLAVESEAATVLGLRLAAAVDSGEDDFGRLATAVAKFWVCKRAPAVAGEALECLGGNGYVEESGMPRLFRESPLNSIWEGSGNVIALDVLRALAREPAAGEAVLAEVDAAAGGDAAAGRGGQAAAGRPGPAAVRGRRPAGRRQARARPAGFAAGPARAGPGRRRVLRHPARSGRAGRPVRARRPGRRRAGGPGRTDPLGKSPHRSCRDGRRRSDPLLSRPSRAREHTVKYMIMMFGSAAEMTETQSPEWITEMIGFMRDLDKELIEAGEMVFNEGLQDGDSAKLVRLVDGVPVTTDGPFAESKESLIGFWVLDVADEARILEIAGRIVKYSGLVEVRPVGVAPDVA